jgi:hypothetical protein
MSTSGHPTHQDRRRSATPVFHPGREFLLAIVLVLGAAAKREGRAGGAYPAGGVAEKLRR